MASLKRIGQLPPNAKLFTADAVSMYTNIDTSHGLEAMRTAFIQLADKIPTDFPDELILDALGIIMRNNVFQFGDTHWLQLNGTAMGTPPACTWATIYYGVHERSCLLANFSSNLLYLGRFIDDMFGIWVPNDGDPNAWDAFKMSLPYGILEWEASELTNKVNFLDLTISINEDRHLNFSTYQKAMNLYLYVPSGSAHPPGVLRGLIFGGLRKYYHQNTRREDYKRMVSLFFDRIVARGHDPQQVRSIFVEAAKRIDEETSGRLKPRPQVKPKQRLFYHTEYHPHGASRRQIREAYGRSTSNFNGILDVKQFTVAYSRPTNLKNLLTSSRLHQASGKEVSTFIPAQQRPQQPQQP